MPFLLKALVQRRGTWGLVGWHVEIWVIDVALSMLEAFGSACEAIGQLWRSGLSMSPASETGAGFIVMRNEQCTSDGIAAGGYFRIRIVFGLVKSNRPSWPPSVPRPDCFCPPNVMSTP